MSHTFTGFLLNSCTYICIIRLAIVALPGDKYRKNNLTNEVHVADSF